MACTCLCHWEALAPWYSLCAGREISQEMSCKCHGEPVPQQGALHSGSLFLALRLEELVTKYVSSCPTGRFASVLFIALFCISLASHSHQNVCLFVFTSSDIFASKVITICYFVFWGNYLGRKDGFKKR